MATDETVYVEQLDNTLVFIYQNIQLSITLLDDDIISKNDLKEEELFVKLIKRNLNVIIVEPIIEIGKKIITTLTNYCIICADELEYPSTTFITCGQDNCQYASEEILMDNYVVNAFRENYQISKFLLNTMYYASKSERKDKIFEPFPTIFLKSKDIKLERGKLSALAGNNISQYKDFGTINNILNKNSIDKFISDIKISKNDTELVEKIGREAYSLIKFALKSNKTNLRPCLLVNNLEVKENLFNESQKKRQNRKKSIEYTNINEELEQYEVIYHPSIEEKFKNNAKNFGTIYLFHGSNYANWYSIMRNGIKICSNTELMTAGMAHGAGIYLASNIGISIGYASGEKQILGIFEVINNNKKFTNFGGIFVVKDENILLLRYIIVIPTASVLNTTDFVQKINDKINKGIKEEKKIKDNKSNNLRTKRLLNEYKRVKAAETSKVGFYVELREKDNLDIWRIFITDFETDAQIKKDLVELGIKVIELEIIFPEQYPIEPPFIRIVYPRFAYRTGHITSGGSICMEILTKSGWSAAYSMENLIIDIKSHIIEGDGQIDRKNYNRHYTFNEAKESFYRVAGAHGWQV